MVGRVDTLNETGQRTIKLIFMIEDEEDIAQVIIQVIQHETPHHIHHHTTGRDALQAIHIHTPHLFILNYHLPDMTGLQLHDQLHTFDHLKDAPTLLISAQNPPLDEVRKRQITYLAKPFDLSVLLDTINTLLSQVT